MDIGRFINGLNEVYDLYPDADVVSVNFDGSGLIFTLACYDPDEKRTVTIIHNSLTYKTTVVG